MLVNGKQYTLDDKCTSFDLPLVQVDRENHQGPSHQVYPKDVTQDIYKATLYNKCIKKQFCYYFYHLVYFWATI